MRIRRLFSIILACALLFSVLAVPAFALEFSASGSNSKFYLCPLEDIPYKHISKKGNKTGTFEAGKDFTHVMTSRPASFDDLYALFQNPSNNTELGRYKPSNATTTNDPAVLTSTTSFAMMMSNLSGDERNVNVTNKIEIANRNARIGVSNIDGAVKLSVPGMSVSNGKLLIQNAVLSGASSAPPTPSLQVLLSEPITVETGGELYLDIREGQASPIPGTGGEPVADKLVAPAGESAIVLDGGTAHLGAFLVERAAGDTSDAPLVSVNRGNLIIEEGSAFSSGADGMPDYTPGPLGPVAGWHTAITNGNSDQPAITVAKDATLTLKGGEITANGNGIPAIQVAAGGTVDIPVDSKAVVTTTNNSSQAIDLAADATVKKGDIVTVVVSDANGTENYVDNNGNIILAKGATTGEGASAATLNAAVILPDGTIIEGSEDTAPTLETTSDSDGGTTTTVTVPAGGSVTKPEGEKQVLTSGGSVTSAPKADGGTDTRVEENTIPVTGVTLDNPSLSLTVGGTATLNATVMPENATDKTITWSSSDDTVATVDKSGKVTAVKDGTAIITAIVGTGAEAKTATCSVTVTTTYTVTAPSNVAGGSVTVSPKNASKGSIVTITVKPDEGYDLDTLTVTDKDGKKIELTDKGDGKYTFNMPASKVNIEVRFVKEAHVCPSAKFTDVDVSQYYHEAVDWAVTKGVTEGTSATAFSPNASCTRAQMVTFLWRAAGSPEVNYIMPFTDVDEKAYYAEAVRWAVKEGITKGTSATTFSPDTTVTRAQVVTFLYRYAEEPATNGENPFTDVAADAYYASAVQWAVDNDITVGTSETTFSPESDCTRAQSVTFLYRDLAE